MARTDTAHVVHIPAAAHLQGELAAAIDEPRVAAVQRIKALRRRELATIAAHHLEHINEVTGLDVTTSIASVTDAIIVALAERAFRRGGGAGWRDQVAVFALGGYGRGELNPFSDIDLLVYASDRRPPWLEAANAELQALLWDVGFQVGASLRDRSELERILKADFVTATALIEQRPLVASAATTGAMGELLDWFRRKRRREFLAFKLEELAQRRAQAGISLFLMEPNLKTNPGCLRDVQLLRNIAFVIFGSRNLLALEELEVITRQDLMGVAHTNDHLLAVRSLLHFHHRRKHDVFQLADQLRVASQLGYADVSRLRAVEHLMKLHYALVLHVHQTLELTISRLRGLGHLGRRLILIASRRKLNEDFVVIQGQVYLAHHDFWQRSDAGARLIRMCRLAQEREARISLELQRTIKAHLESIDDEVRHDPALGRIFLAIIGDIGRIKPILSDMHNAGLLGAFLPEFGNLTCHMQFDSYHQYTVDEHTLIAMGNLDAVWRGELPGLPGMRALLGEIRRRDLLALGLLLHDMGKYMGRGHVARGALMVAPLAKRFGLDEVEEELLYFLVERHVALSDASRMRDFREPSFLRAFAERIGDEDRLDMLYCLTYADAKAVGEGILTGWQEALLGEIRQAVVEELARARGIKPASHQQRVLNELTAAGMDVADSEAWLGDMSANYQYQVPPGEAAKHVRVAREARQGGVGLEYELKDKYLHVSASLPDRHGLFADVCATLTGHGFDILDARTWVTQSAWVLYSFRLGSANLVRLQEPGPWQRLRRDLAAAGKGPIDATAMLARRRNLIGTSQPADSRFDDPAVKVEQRTSDHHTIVDINVKDEPGLLSRLCRTISDFGCEISYACINTMGDVAVDVFYVDRSGRKLADDDADALRRHLVESLQLTPGSSSATDSATDSAT